MAITDYVMRSTEHPTAERVWHGVRGRVTSVSRATVYNTLNLLVRRGLLHHFTLPDGRTVFDPRLEPHHHFVNLDTGGVMDLPWTSVTIDTSSFRDGIAVEALHLVVFGRSAAPTLPGPR